ncbi:MAG: hypothetical protein HRU27_13090 [Rhizobiaceae bacterium]|nr:hypothetical protein [Rhizobiaceae bacterium]
MNTHAQRRQNRRRRVRRRQQLQERRENQSCQSAPSPFAAAAATPPAQLLSQAKLLQSIAKIVEKQVDRMSREEAKSKPRAGLSE